MKLHDIWSGTSQKHNISKLSSYLLWEMYQVTTEPGFCIQQGLLASLVGYIVNNIKVVEVQKYTTEVEVHFYDVIELSQEL